VKYRIRCPHPIGCAPNPQISGDTKITSADAKIAQTPLPGGKRKRGVLGGVTASEAAEMAPAVQEFVKRYACIFWPTLAPLYWEIPRFPSDFAQNSQVSKSE
jgi:hypothetical protein